MITVSISIIIITVIGVILLLFPFRNQLKKLYRYHNIDFFVFMIAPAPFFIIGLFTIILTLKDHNFYRAVLWVLYITFLIMILNILYVIYKIKKRLAKKKSKKTKK